MRQLTASITLIVMLLLAGTFASAQESTTPIERESGTANQQRPNIVLIMADDLGWSDLGCYGAAHHHTPSIDRLAAESVRFTDAYSAGPNCSPTRAALMTGLYGPRHGIYTAGKGGIGDVRDMKLDPPRNREILRLKFTTIAEVLHEAGYATALVGKWHLGNPGKNGPQEQGFDINIGGHLAGKPQAYFSPYDNPTLPDGPDGEFLTERLTDEAIAFIEKHRDAPFFLYMPHYTPHWPLEAPIEIVDRYAAQFPALSNDLHTYAAMVETFDTSVGRVMQCLKDAGVWDNTLFIVYSDNGNKLRGPEQVLRGLKDTMFEGGIRVPLIVHWPGVTPTGVTCDEPVHSVDFFPTFVEAAGVKDPPEVDGISMLPVLRDPEATLEREFLYWHFPVYRDLSDDIERSEPCGVIRSRRWKLIEYFEDMSIELYDMRDDPNETTDRSTEEQDTADRLVEQLHAWRKRVNAPMPTKRAFKPLWRDDPRSRSNR